MSGPGPDPGVLRHAWIRRVRPSRHRARWFALASPFAVVLLFLGSSLPVGSAGSSSGLKFTAPFGAAVSYNYSSIYGNGRFAVPPSFDPATGAFRFSENAHGNNNPGSWIYLYFDTTGPNFTAPNSCLCLVRTHWHFAWQMNVSTVANAYAQAELEICVSVYDRTTGSTWGCPSPASYVNYSSLSGANATGHKQVVAKSFDGPMTLPVVVGLTKGDRYSVIIGFTTYLDAWSNAGTYQGASARLTVGTSGARMALTEVTIR